MSHQLDNSGLNRTPTWNLQPFKDFANTSWHRWNVQPLSIKAVIGVGSAVVVGLICVIVRKALSSSQVRSDKSTDDKKANGASAAKDNGVPPSKPAASDRASKGKDANPVASAIATKPKGVQKEPEKPKYVDILPNQVSKLPFRSLYGKCLNEQIDPAFPDGYVQGIYSFNPQACKKAVTSATTKIAVTFYCEGQQPFSVPISMADQRCDIFLRNLPYQKEVKVQFTADGASFYEHIFKADQVRGVYSPGRSSVLLVEHEWKGIANPALLQANIQPGVQGWNIDAPADLILTSTAIKQTQPKSKEGHYHLYNSTELVQVVIFELGLALNDRDFPGNRTVAYSVVMPPKGQKIISKESLIASVELAIGKSIPAGAKIGISNIQQIVYTKST
jgi:hypothetical protein